MMTIRELANERYAVLKGLRERTVHMINETIDRLEEFLQRPATLEDFTDLTMARFLRWRATTPRKGRLASPATVAKDKSHLSSLASLAARKRLIPEFIDFPRLKVPTRPPRGYTVEEVSAIIRESRHCYGKVGPVPAAWLFMTLVRACWETGERVGGLLAVRWGEVDLERRVITVLGETRKDRTTTIERQISGELAAWLTTQRRGDNCLVWPWLENRKQDSIYQILRKICARSGVTPRGFHAIRKASGSYVKAGGGDATEHLGHASARTTQKHYLDTRIVGQQSALDFLPPLDLTTKPKPK
jgi:integrase